MYDLIIFKFKWWREHSLRDQVLNVSKLLSAMPALEHEVLAKLCSLLDKTRGNSTAFVLAYTFGPSILSNGKDAKALLAAGNGDMKKLRAELIVNPRLVNSFLAMLIKYHGAIFEDDMSIVESEEVGDDSGVVSLQDRITAVTRARLIKVYTEKNPSKLANVDQLCYKYRGKEREMLQVCSLCP